MQVAGWLISLRRAGSPELLAGILLIGMFLAGILLGGIWLGAVLLVGILGLGARVQLRAECVDPAG